MWRPRRSGHQFLVFWAPFMRGVTGYCYFLWRKVTVSAPPLLRCSALTFFSPLITPALSCDGIYGLCSLGDAPPLEPSGRGAAIVAAACLSPSCTGHSQPCKVRMSRRRPRQCPLNPPSLLLCTVEWRSHPLQDVQPEKLFTERKWKWSRSAKSNSLRPCGL